MNDFRKRLLSILGLSAFATTIWAIGTLDQTAKSFVGNWSGRVSMTEAEISKVAKEKKLSAKQVTQSKIQLSTIRIHLILKQDMSFMMDQKNGIIGGRWTYSNSVVILTPESMGGKSKNEILQKYPEAKTAFEPIKLKATKDGKTLSGSIQRNQGGPSANLIFTPALGK